MTDKDKERNKAYANAIPCTGIKTNAVRSCRLLQTGNLEFELQKFPVRSILGNLTVKGRVDEACVSC